MKIAITSTGATLDDQVEARFGRCPCFLIVDTDSMALEAIENPNVAAGGGAGVQSAQLMADKGVKTVLTGNCGPNAFQVFGAAGIQVIVGVSGSLDSVIVMPAPAAAEQPASEPPSPQPAADTTPPSISAVYAAPNVIYQQGCAGETQSAVLTVEARDDGGIATV